MQIVSTASLALAAQLPLGKKKKRFIRSDATESW
jgi:hypothetical protein